MVEWGEGVPEKLSGPALLRVVNSINPTHYVRRFLTAALGMAIAPGTKANERFGPGRKNFTAPLNVADDRAIQYAPLAAATVADLPSFPPRAPVAY